MNKILSLANEISVVVDACSTSVFSMSCINAGAAFGKKHSQEAMYLLPYLMDNITALAPCFTESTSSTNVIQY